MRIKPFLLIFTVIFLSKADSIIPDDTSPLKAFSSNQGLITYFQFSFTPKSEITSNAFIQIQFPGEFTASSFQLPIRCNVIVLDVNTPSPCSVINSTIVNIPMSSILQSAIKVQLGKVQIPKDVTASGYFKIRTLFNNVVVDSNEVFRSLTFSNKPSSLLSATVTKLSNDKINEGSSWLFNFKTTSSFAAGYSLRFTFAPGFSSQKAQCDVDGLFGSTPNTIVNQIGTTTMVTCQLVQKILSGSQAVKIINMVNPSYSGLFQGFAVDVIDGDSSVVLQRIDFSGDAYIYPGLMTVNYTASNTFKYSNATYSFRINLVNNVPSQGRLYINFTKNWKIVEPQCAIISGVKSLTGSTPSCSLIPSAYSYVITNFDSLSSFQQIIVSTYVMSPQIQNNYTLKIGTFDIATNSLIDMTTINIPINSTYGQALRYIGHPMKQSVKLDAGKTGALEFTFFLQTLLPQTNVMTTGKIRIDIFPKIPYPPAHNGVLKCYFYMTVAADSCVYTDTAADRTVIYITTPQDFSYKESEMPITITTEGHQTGFFDGITLDPLIKRYIFWVHFWKSNSDFPTNVPDEVFFTEWIPEQWTILAADMPVATALHGTSGEFTHLKFDYRINQSLVEPARNYIIRIYFDTFSTNAWDQYLGYGQGQWIQNYPCVVRGAGINPLNSIVCEMNTTGTASPNYPYVQINGIDTSSWTATSQILIDIPRIKIRSGASIGAIGYVWFKVQEETPGYLNPTIELHTGYYNLFAVTSSIDAATAASNVWQPESAILNVQTTHRFTHANSPSTSPEYVMYDLPTTAFRLLVNEYYTNANGDQFWAFGNANVARFNWLLFKPASGQGATTTADVPINHIQNGQYVQSVDTATAYIVTSTECSKKLQFIMTTATQPIQPSYWSFAFDSKYDRTAHSWKNFEFRFVAQFQTQNYIPDSGSITFTFTNTVFGVNEPKYIYFYQGLTALTSMGITYKYLSTTQLQILNIKAVPAGTVITVYLMLNSLSETNNYLITVETWWQEGMTNLVDSKYSCGLDYEVSVQSVTNAQKFSVQNPTYVYWRHIPTINYIGKVHFKINPQTTPYYLVIEFESPFTTANTFYEDLLYCEINSVPCYCGYDSASLPLRIRITTGSSGFNANVLSTVMIDTQFVSPYNGIKFPSTPGYYYVATQYQNSGNGLQQSYTDFIYVKPNDLGWIKASHMCITKNWYNVFTINFMIRTSIPAYSAGGRMYIEFPTKDATGVGFSATLSDFYSGNGSPVGCWFQTGGGQIAPESTERLQCDLISSPDTNSEPVYVNIRNFAATSGDTEVKVMIAMVKNPNMIRADIDIGVKIFKYDKTAGTYTYYYHDYFNVFLNLETAEPGTDVTHPYDVTFPSTYQVYHTMEDMNHKVSYNQNLVVGDWFATQYPTDFVGDDNYDSVRICPGEFACYHFKDINLMLWNVVSTINQSPTWANIPIDQQPISVAQTITTFYSYAWVSTYYKGRVVESITVANWHSIVGPLLSVGFNFPASQQKNVKGRIYTMVEIFFTTTNIIPSSGTIVIYFPAEISIVYANCRSSITTGSKLYSVAGNNIGDIGCAVQNTRQWVITNFQTLPANSVVKIYGYIDMHTANTNYIQARTFSDRDKINCWDICRIIDEHTQIGYFTPLTYAALEIDHTFTVFDRAPLRVSYVGPFEIRTQFPAVVASTEYIELWLDRYSHMRSQSGGFYYNAASTDNYAVCVITQVAINYQAGCQLTKPHQTNYLLYRLQPNVNLVANVDYIITITTRRGSGVEGILWPTVPATYQVQMLASGVTVFSKQLKVHGAAFTQLKVDSLNYRQSELALIYVRLIPSTQIDTNDLLVFELPTISTDSINLFDDDGGLYIDYQNLNFDVVYGITSMTCKFYKGFRTLSNPCKIICSSFSSVITTSTELRFLFEIKNPSGISSNKILYVPIQVYSIDYSTQRETNWDMLQLSIIVNDASVTPLAKSPGYILSNNKYFVTGVTLRIITFGTQTLQGGRDYYVIRLGMEFNSNGYLAGKLVYGGQTGDVILCKNLRSIVMVPVSGTTLSPGPVDINLAWNNPYGMMEYTTEKTGTGYIVQHYTFTTESFTFAESTYPTYIANVDYARFSLTSLNNNLEIGQREDFLFSVTAWYWAQAKRVYIFLPSTTFNFYNDDCVEDYGSDVEITSCSYYKPQKYIIIDIADNPRHLMTTAQTLKIRSHHRGFSNPTSVETLENNAFLVKIFNWNDKPNTIDPYADLYLVQKTDGTSSTGSTAWTTATVAYPPLFKIPLERYNTEFFHTTNRAPLMVEFIADQEYPALSGANKHILKIFYGNSQLSATAATTTGDVIVNNIVCYLRGKFQYDCSIDVTNEVVTVNFQDAILQYEKIAVKVSPLNPYNIHTQDGFAWTPSSAIGSITLQIQQSGQATIKYIDSQGHYFHYSTTSADRPPENGITSFTVSDYGHKFASQINIMTFSINLARSDINSLVFQFPTVNEDDVRLYDSNAFMNWQRGTRYPCTYGTGVTPTTNNKLVCFYDTGKQEGFGVPSSIYVTNFAYTAGTAFQISFLLTNQRASTYQLVRLYAHGGTTGSTPIGVELRGFREIHDTGFTYVEGGASVTTYYNQQYIKPSKSIGLASTNLRVYTYQALAINDYTVVKTYLYLNGKQQCTTALDASSQMVFQYQNNIYSYLIVKHTADYSAGSYIDISLACNVFLSFFEVYHFAATHTKLDIIYDFPTESNILNPLAVNYAIPAPTVVYTNYVWGTQNTITYLLYDLTVIRNANFIITTQTILGIEFNSNTFMMFDRPTSCSVVSGLLNYNDPHKYITCEVDPYYARIYIKNFDRFDTNNAFILQIKANNANYQIPGAETQRFLLWACPEAMTADSSDGYGQTMVNQAISFTYPFNSRTNSRASFVRNNFYNSGGNFIINFSFKPLSTQSTTGTTELYLSIFPGFSFNSLTCSVTGFSSTSDKYDANTYSSWACAVVNQYKIKLSISNLNEKDSTNSQYWYWNDNLSFNVEVNSINIPAQKYQFSNIEYYVGSVLIDHNYFAFTQTANISPNGISVGSISASQKSTTELEVYFNTFYSSAASTGGQILWMEFPNHIWGNTVVQGLDSTVEIFPFPCKYSKNGGALTNIKCYRHLQTSLYDESITFAISFAAGDTMRFYIPMIKLPDSTYYSWYFTLKLFCPNLLQIFDQTTIQPYFAQNSNNLNQYSNENLSYGIDISLTNIYPAAVRSSLASYGISFSNIRSWFTYAVMYIDFGAVGPMSHTGFCDDTYYYTTCRAYNADGISILIAQFNNVYEYCWISYWGYGHHSQCSQRNYLITSSVNYPTLKKYVSGNYNIKWWVYRSDQYVAAAGTSSVAEANLVVSDPAITSAPGILQINKASQQGLNFVSFSMNSYLMKSAGKISISLTNNGIASYCFAFLQDSPVEFGCTVSGSNIDINPLTGATKSGGKFYLIYGVQQPAANLVANVNVYYSYSSSTNYFLILQNPTPITQTIDTTFTSLTRIETGFLKIYRFCQRIYHGTPSVSYTPLRFIFRTGIGSALSGTSQVQFAFSDTIDISAGNTLICYVNEFQVSGGFKQIKAPCSCSVSSPWRTCTITQPILHNYLDQILYEIILTATAGTGQGFNNPQLTSTNFNYKFIQGVPETNNYYFKSRLWAYQDSTTVILSEYRYTTNRCAYPNHLFLKFTITQTFGVSDYYPSSFIEIIFPTLTISQVSQSASQYITCTLLNFNTFSNFRNNPICIVQNECSSCPLIIRIEKFASVSSGTTFTVMIDNISLPTVSVYTLHDLTVMLGNYAGANNLRLRSKNSKYLFMYDHLYSTSLTTETAIQMSNPSNVNWDASGQYYTNNIESWYFTTNANQGSKLRLILSNDGLRAVGNNPLSNIYFTDSQSHTFTVLWINTNQGTFYLQSRGKDSTTNTNFYIQGIQNPRHFEKEAYGVTPQLTMEFISDFKHITSVVLKYPGNAEFTTSNPNVRMTSCSTQASKWTFDQLIDLQCIINFSGLNLQYHHVEQIKIDFTAGVTRIDSCRVLYSAGNNYFGCSTPTATQVLVNGLQTYTTSSTWEFNMFYVPTTTATLTVQVRIYATNTLLISDQTTSYTIGGYSASYTQPTGNKFQLGLVHYVKNYEEIQKTRILSTTSTTKRLQFKHRLVDSYDFSSSNSNYDDWVQFGVSADYNQPAPTTAADLIRCLWQSEVVGNYTYGLGLWSRCSFTSSRYYNLHAPLGFTGITGMQIFTISPDEMATSATLTWPNVQKMMEVDISQYKPYDQATPKQDVQQFDLTDAFSSVAFDVLTYTQSEYNVWYMSFVPRTNIAVNSASRELKFCVEVDPDVVTIDFGIDAHYIATGLGDFYPGRKYSFLQTASFANSAVVLSFGQIIAVNDMRRWMRFCYGGLNALVAGTSYQLKLPVINPGHSKMISFRYVFEEVNANQQYPTIVAQYDWSNLFYCTTASLAGNPFQAVMYTSGTQRAQDTAITTGISFQYWGDSGDKFFQPYYRLVLKYDTTLPGLSQTQLKASSFAYSSPAWTTETYPDILLFVTWPNSAIEVDKYCNNDETCSSWQYSSCNQYDYGGNCNGGKGYYHWQYDHDTTITLSGQIATLDTQSYGWTSVKYFKNKNKVLEDLSIARTLLADYSISQSRPFTFQRGYQERGSTIEIQVSILTPIIVEGGRLEVYLGGYYQITALGARCFPRLNFVESVTQPLGCFKSSSTSYVVDGFQYLPAGTTLTIGFFLQATIYSSLSLSSIKVFGKDSIIATITSFDSTYFYNTGNVNAFYLNFMYYEYTYPNEFGYLTANLKNQRQNYVFNTDSLVFYNARRLNPNFVDVVQSNYFYPGGNVGSNLYVRHRDLSSNTNQHITHSSVGYDYTGPLIQSYIPKNYPLQQGIEYEITYTTEASPSYNENIYRYDLPALYTFYMLVYKSSTYQEYSYYWYDLRSKPVDSLVVTSFQRGINQLTVLYFEYTINEQFVNGDTIIVEFTTDNGVQQVYADDLGLGFTTRDFQLDCREGIGLNLISNTRITCNLVRGSYSSKIPPRLYIPITQTINSGSNIKFYVATIKNPGTVGLYCTFRIRMTKTCRQDGFQCTYYQSTGYYQLVNHETISYSNYDQNGSQGYYQLTSNTNVIYDTAATHSVFLDVRNGISGPVSVDDMFLIKYDTKNNRLQEDCTATTLCLVFPRLGWVLFKPSISTASTESFTISYSGMNNPWYRRDSTYYNGELWQQSTQTCIRGYAIQLPSYSYYSTGYSLTFQTTQTPQVLYYLFDYMNTVQITLSGMFNSDVKMFWLFKTSQANNFQIEYCNVTITVPTGQRNPYPLRFNCISEGSDKFRIYPTTEFPVWSSTLQSYSINIFVKFFLPLTAPVGTLGDSPFTVEGHSYTDTSYNGDHGINTVSGVFDISPYIQPNLGFMGFFTLSSFLRSARLGDQIEFYLLLQPIESTTPYKIDRMIFRAPEEFPYPKNRNLDNCQIIGTLSNPISVTSCYVERTQGQTLITLIPQTTYDHLVKIIRLSDSKLVNLFSAPPLPGPQYNMTVQLYSGTRLLEAQTKNISEVLGYDLDLTTLKVTVCQDAQTNCMFEFQFKVGQTKIPAGYDSDSATYFSQILLIFESKLGFADDLGTGLKTGSELGCTVKTQTTLTFKNQGRLKCVLINGYDDLHLPNITVSGYDEIPANTLVSFMITGLRTLTASATSTVSIGVTYFFKTLGTNGFYYQPTVYVPAAATAYAATASTYGQVLSIVGPNQVLGLNDFVFSFYTGLPVTSADYIVFQFPADYFERYSDYSSVTATVKTPASATDIACSIYVFGYSNMIYVSPSSTLFTNTNYVLTISKLISSAYANSGTFTITAYTQVSNKRDNTFSFVFTRAITAGDTFNLANIFTTSTVGGEIDVALTFDIITGHQLPLNGAVSVEFPEALNINLFQNGIYCEIFGFPSDSQAYCKLGSKSRVDIFRNNADFSASTKYTLKVYKLQNPNVDTSLMKFTVTSYYDSNIYLNRVITKAQFSFPKITIISPKSCQLAVKSQYSDVSVTSVYTFSFSCTSFVRDSTKLLIYLPYQYAETNNVLATNTRTFTCKSGKSSTLSSADCPLTYEKSSQNLYLQVALRQIEAQQQFSIIITLTNPKIEKPDYSFNAYFYLQAIIYAQALNQGGAQQLVTITKPLATSSTTTAAVTTTSSVQLKFLNLPQNAGAPSTHIFSIPPITGLSSYQISNIDIQYPPNFSQELSSNLQCYLFISKNYNSQVFSYLNMIAISSSTSKDFNSIPCSITQSQLLSISSISEKQGNSTIKDYWFHFVIENVINPSKYEALPFKIVFQFNQQILWKYEQAIVYFISPAATQMKTSSIQVSNQNIKVNAIYIFNYTFEQNLRQSSNVALQLTLPSIYSKVIKNQLSSPKCYIMLQKETTYVRKSCSFNNYALIVSDISFTNLISNYISLKVDTIANPDSVFECKTQKSYYDTKIVDVLSNNLLYMTSSSVDDRSCVTFLRDLYEIKLFGPTILNPGLSYDYVIQLEQPAFYLKIIPSTVNQGLKFNPGEIVFNDITVNQIGFSLRVRSDVLPGQYTIQFAKKEEASGDFYSELLPFQVTVQQLNTQSNSSRIISIPDKVDDTIGHPFIVPVSLSSPPYSTLYLSISLKTPNSKVKITPAKIEITSKTKSTSFELEFNTRTVPEQIVLVFSLSSMYEIIHTLEQTQKYLTFSRSINKLTDPPALTVQLTTKKIEQIASEIGKSVVNINYAQTLEKVAKLNEVKNENITRSDDKVVLLQPKIFSFNWLNSTANNASFSIKTTQISQIKYIVIKQGSSVPKKEAFISGVFADAVAIGSIQMIPSQKDPFAKSIEFVISGIESQNNFIIYVLLQSSLGFSDISSVTFQTQQLSFGALILFNTFEQVTSQKVIDALSKTLRIKSSRLQYISQQSSYYRNITYNSKIMLKPTFPYKILLTPDAKYDDPNPFSIAMQIQSNSNLATFKKQLPSFDETQGIQVKDGRIGMPKITTEPYVKVNYYYNITIGFKLWEQGKVFATLRTNDTKDIWPNSVQISQGFDIHNKPLNKYRVFSGVTDINGNIDIIFDDLKPETCYECYITVGANTPYYPSPLYGNKDIRQLKFCTLKNYNLKLTKSDEDKLSAANPDLWKELQSLKNSKKTNGS